MNKLFKAIKKKGLELKLKYYEKQEQKHDKKMMKLVDIWANSEDLEKAKDASDLIQMENSLSKSYGILVVVTYRKIKKLEEN